LPVEMTNSAAVHCAHLRCVESRRMAQSPEAALLKVLVSAILLKKSAGCTRWAASCGQAYTQLGSFWSLHKLQEVALRTMRAFLALSWPAARIASSSRTGPSALNSCRLMLPYGQLLAHRPQPMHQSSMMTSSEFCRRMA